LLECGGREDVDQVIKSRRKEIGCARIVFEGWCEEGVENNVWGEEGRERAVIYTF